MTLFLTAQAEDDDDYDEESESVRTAGCVTLEPLVSAKIISPLSQLCVTVLRHLVTRPGCDGCHPHSADHRMTPHDM